MYRPRFSAASVAILEQAKTLPLTRWRHVNGSSHLSTSSFPQQRAYFWSFGVTFVVEKARVLGRIACIALMRPILPQASHIPRSVCVLGTPVSRAKAAEPIEIPFRDILVLAKRHLAPMCTDWTVATAMLPYVKLLWPLVYFGMMYLPGWKKTALILLLR